MAEIHRYTVDGMTLDIPLHYDEQAKMCIEDYPDFLENPTWTPTGYRVLFSGTDACAHAQAPSSGECPDCGSCTHFRRISETTWIGLCQHPNFRRK